MSRYDIVLLTESRYVSPRTITPYIQNLLNEDAMVRSALESRGLAVTRIDWADREFEWSSAHAALFRTTWDYFDHFPAFTRWLDGTSPKLRFINDISLIRWNMDKHYLADLEKKNIRTIPTLFLEQGETRTLQQIVGSVPWNDAVLKPAVSGGGKNTFRFNRKMFHDLEQTFSGLISGEAMMLQEFQNSIVTGGEIAVMVIDGIVTHAVQKRAKEGEFRVQDDFGGTVHRYTPTTEEIEFAQSVVSHCTPKPVYARVDMIRDNEQQLSVVELELIEPEMWFRFHPPAADRLADAVVRMF
ncbi:MAG: hypothetical protein WCT99_08220 [Bacteroidota bacterium]|jgi:glutathione synthase/RimK-type ligase-like ATP-grasp enzyme